MAVPELPGGALHHHTAAGGGSEQRKLLHHYVVVREHLARGVLAAQVTHAAGESARLAPHLPPDTHAVVLECSAQDLERLECKLADSKIPHAAIREPDAPWNGALMAVAVAPLPKHLLKRFMSNLRLLR